MFIFFVVRSRSFEIIFSSCLYCWPLTWRVNKFDLWCFVYLFICFDCWLLASPPVSGFWNFFLCVRKTIAATKIAGYVYVMRRKDTRGVFDVFFRLLIGWLCILGGKYFAGKTLMEYFIGCTRICLPRLHRFPIHRKTVYNTIVQDVESETSGLYQRPRYAYNKKVEFTSNPNITDFSIIPARLFGVRISVRILECFIIIRI